MRGLGSSYKLFLSFVEKERKKSEKKAQNRIESPFFALS